MAVPKTPAVGEVGVSTAYISEDFLGAVILRPGHFLESQFVFDLGAQGGAVEKLLAEFDYEFHINARLIEELIILYDADTSMAGSLLLLGDSLSDKWDPAIIVRMREPVPQDWTLRSYLDIRHKVVEIDGQQCYVSQDHVMFCPDPKTFIITNESRVSKHVRARGVKTPLTEALETVPLHQDLVMLFDFAAQDRLLGKLANAGAEEIPPPISEIARALAPLKFLTITGSIDRQALLTISMHGRDLAAAIEVEKLTQDLRRFLQTLLSSDTEQPLPLPAELKRLAADLVNASSVTRLEETVVINVRAVPSFSQVPKLLDPALAEALRWMERYRHEKYLRILAIGVVLYEHRHDHLPPAGRAGEPGTGLSWRVHILPFIEEQKLYEQFNLDEPWDSPTNKALIDKMPLVFTNLGSDMKGKTSFHVFIGEKTPFGDGTTQLTTKDLTDGEESTLLIVEAGADKAVEWTRPGGLPFNANNPLSELGKIPEDGFLVSFMDDRVRFLSKETAERLLHLLIQHADGEVIEEDF